MVEKGQEPWEGRRPHGEWELWLMEPGSDKWSQLHHLTSECLYFLLSNERTIINLEGQLWGLQSSPRQHTETVRAVAVISSSLFVWPPSYCTFSESKKPEHHARVNTAVLRPYSSPRSDQMNAFPRRKEDVLNRESTKEKRVTCKQVSQNLVSQNLSLDPRPRFSLAQNHPADFLQVLWKPPICLNKNKEKVSLSSTEVPRTWWSVKGNCSTKRAGVGAPGKMSRLGINASSWLLSRLCPFSSLCQVLPTYRCCHCPCLPSGVTPRPFVSLQSEFGRLWT